MELTKLRFQVFEVTREIDRHALFCTVPTSHELRKWAECLDAYLGAEDAYAVAAESEPEHTIPPPRHSAILLH
jgi:hypothetical protein